MRRRISLDLCHHLTACVSVMDYYHQCYLQVIDMLFSVQVDATGPLLDGHN